MIATGSQPRITPTPSQQRFNDTMAAPGMATPTPRPPTGAQAALARPATNPPAVAAVEETAPQGTELPGHSDPYLGSTIADRYRVISKLGEGGMGVVYLAEHVFIEKRVALKVLSEDFARKADLVARFMQEAKAASKIGHENIVDITDFGETASGSVFFAMEFLDGMDLAGHIKSGGAMSFPRAKQIMNQICRALGAAHSKGIIHRDMKPENVYLVTREGRADFVKVLDFGIAKMSALDEGGSRLTRTGMIFGTPEYMSPEQAKGDKPDHRVDIYAAGCILYEMLTGDVPFHAETFMGVLTKHMFENPEP
ncbi:MAG TPA: protein kinase, partial [Polyangia bacterium]